MGDPIGNFFKAVFSRKMPVRTRDREVEGEAPTAEKVDEQAPQSKYAPRDFSLAGHERPTSALTSWSSAMVKSNIILVSNVILAVGIMLMVFMQMNQKPTIIVKPPVLTGEIRIEDGLPNKEWQQSWALYVAHLLGNINPRNVDFVSRQVISLLSPSLQMAKERDIRQMVEMMRMSNLTQSFEVSDLRYDAGTQMVWCWGNKTTQLVSSKKNDNASEESSADRRRWTFEFIIRLNEMGMPVVTHIDQYEGLPKFERAGDVTDDGSVLEPPKKNNKDKKSSKEQK